MKEVKVKKEYLLLLNLQLKLKEIKYFKSQKCLKLLKMLKLKKFLNNLAKKFHHKKKMNQIINSKSMKLINL